MKLRFSRHTQGKSLTFSRQKHDFKMILMSNESNIRARVLLSLLNSLRKRDKMLGKPRILSLFLSSFNKFKTNMSTHVISSI